MPEIPLPKKRHRSMPRAVHAAAQLPTDVTAHPKLVVTRKSGEAILKATRTGKPTKALRDLLRKGH